MSRVLILGSSYDSLLAAHAASMLGHDVKIVSDTPGAEFEPGPNLLLNPIPLIDVAGAPLKVEVRGDPDVWMDKLTNQGGGGREPEEVDLEDGRMVFDSRATLEQLAAMYQPYVQVEERGIGHKDVIRLMEKYTPDITFSGLDKDEICGNREHSFQAAAIVVMAPPKPTVLNQSYLTVSGDTDDAWAMEYSVFGAQGRVYGGHKHPPVAKHKLAGLILPQGTNCDCFAADISPVGRLGAWEARSPRHRSFYRPFATLDHA